MPTGQSKDSVYDRIIEEVFFRHYKPGAKSFEFMRTELEEAALKFNVDPKNLGDIIYSYRFRKLLPAKVIKTAPKNVDWMIVLAGRGKYVFKLAKIGNILPREDAFELKIPDATPEIITRYAKTDEQALLAKVRYNRLIDIFLGITTYSLQSHLRTTVAEVGQIEIDEVYVGIDKNACHYVIPVQAKRDSDKLGAVQVYQDLAWARESLPDLICRPIAAQFMRQKGVIVLFELVEIEFELKIKDERHYRLVPEGDISREDLQTYRRLNP